MDDWICRRLVWARIQTEYQRGTPPAETLAMIRAMVDRQERADHLARGTSGETGMREPANPIV